jgi:nicotinate-nucleotide pyrophosphorylase (carboxylating)
MTVEELIESALKEDVGDGDHTSLSTIDNKSTGTGTVKAKQAGIICGIDVALLVFHKTDPLITCSELKADG